MNETNFTRWCREATWRIRYGPDRAEVYQELMDHLRDHRDALMAQGAAEEDAVMQAVEAMGSAKELAPQLAAAHRPYLGYTLTALKWLMVVLIVVSLIAAGTSGGGTMSQTSSQWLEDNTSIGNYRRILYDEPMQSFSCDNYTLQIEKVALWTPISAEFGEDYAIYLQIRVMQPPFTPKFNAWRYIGAEDSSGCIYIPLNDRSWSGDFNKVSFGGMKYGVFSDTGILVLRNMDGSDIEWVDLYYRRDGRDVSLRIDLSGGDGA